MRKHKTDVNALPDAWAPPANAGQPIGFITTTFTLDAEFFEKECLHRFLALESDAEEDGVVYLIELEEKLAQLRCASLWVDQSRSRTATRNLRWDVLPIRLAGALLHAKLSLLVWQRHLRIIVASANMSQPGYCDNQEVFVALDFPEDKAEAAPIAAGLDLVAFLQSILSADAGMPPGGRTRAEGLLALASQWISDPAKKEANHPRRVQIHAILTGPERAHLPAAAQQLWQAHIGGPIDEAHVLSPFYDQPEKEYAPNKPAEALAAIMRQRGPSRLVFYCADEGMDGSGKVRLNAHQSLETFGRPPGMAVGFSVVHHTVEGFARPLHAKAIRLLQDGGGAMYILGSGNFTSKGLGISGPNYEANIAIILPKQEPDARKAANNIWPEATLLKAGGYSFHPQAGEDEEAAAQDCPLPLFFCYAALTRVSDDCYAVAFAFDKSHAAPGGFDILHNQGQSFYALGTWEAQGKPKQVLVPLPAKNLPGGFEVLFEEGKVAWLPLNIQDAAVMPPPEGLKDLPLDLFATILTSARPLAQIMAAWRKKKAKEAAAGDGEHEATHSLDPHKGVDTSRFLLQRTRRYGAAISAVCAKVCRPAATREALDWRIHGPVGLRAFLDALRRESEGRPDEQSFLLAELLLELSRAVPEPAAGCLDPKDIRKAINAFIRRYLLPALENPGDTTPAIRDYLAAVRGAKSPQTA